MWVAVGSAGINKLVLDFALAVRVPTGFITISTQGRAGKLPYTPMCHFLTRAGMIKRPYRLTGKYQVKLGA